MKTAESGKTKLDNKKLKETLKSVKALHRGQVRMKDGRLTELNATIKSLNAKINCLEKSLESLQSKFTNFQRKSATDMAKLQHTKELIEIKDKKKRDTVEKRKKEGGKS